MSRTALPQPDGINLYLSGSNQIMTEQLARIFAAFIYTHL